MRRFLPRLIILLLLCLSVPFPARAQQKGLFLIQNPLQYIDFTYEFRDLNHSSSGSSSDSGSTTSLLRPKYHIGADYAVYNPEILRGSFSASARLDQAFYSYNPGSSGSNTEPGFEYNITGIFLERKPVSVDFTSRYQLDQALPLYATPYTLYTLYSKAGIRIRGLLPTLLSYSNSNTRTAGLINNTTTENTIASIQTVHNYRNLSNSKLSLTYNSLDNRQTATGYTSQHAYLMLELDNNLAFRALSKAMTLGSNLNIEKDYKDYNGTSLQWREMYAATLGKALRAGLNYTLYKIDRTSYNLTRNQVDGWAEHQLFKSLRTYLSGKADFESYDAGHLNTTTGNLTLAYNKNLPDSSKLNVQIRDTYELKDQSLGVKSMTAYNEKIVVTSPGDPTQRYYLQHYTQPEDVTQIKDSNGYLYAIPAEVEIVVEGQQTYLLLKNPAHLPADNLLFVTYSYPVNGQITYGTNTFGINSSLSLFQGLYNFYVQYQRSDKQLFDGQDMLMVLSPSSSLRGIAEYNKLGHTLGAEYANLDYQSNSKESAAGYWRYTGNVIEKLLLHTDVRNTFNWYTAAGSDSNSPKAYTDNNFAATVTLSRQLFRYGMAQFSGNYLMIRGGSPHRDDISLRLRYSWSLGKLQMAVDAQSYLRDYSSSSQINNYVKFEIRRYF